jgi:hypothetical protein
MIDYKMELNDDQIAILKGEKGPEMQKILETIVIFGDMFDAKRLVPVTHKDTHLVTSFGLGVLKPLYECMEELTKAGIRAKGYLTVDPRPLDYKNVKCSLAEKVVFDKIMYSKQKPYEEYLKKLGLKDGNAFTCTCYLDEVGNIPKKGDVLSWAESSAVVYANSVLGARCNRNSGMLDLFGAIVGYVPEFGLLTDEGRKATWKVYVKTTKKPEAQILGSAVGMKVMEDVPYVYGLDKFIGNELDDENKAYLKDFGAATASNGAVGLYHIDGLTPEAKELGEKLIADDAKEYIIDDAELQRVYDNYPIMWKDKSAKPNLVFIGCPHLTYKQLIDWTTRLSNALVDGGREKVAVRTIMTAAPDVVEKFKSTDWYRILMKTGVNLSSICPLMYTNNPVCMMTHRVATCSNKLRTYSAARYYTEDEILAIISGKKV